MHLAEWARACAVFCPCCTSGWQHPHLPEGGLTLPQSPLLCISAWLLFWVQALSPVCVILGVGPGWLTTLHLVFSPSVLLVTLGCTGLPGTTQLPSFALISWSVSWSQAFCLPSVHERLRNGQESWLERCPGPSILAPMLECQELDCGPCQKGVLSPKYKGTLA